MDPRKVVKRLQTHENDDIVVTFDPNVCRHTGALQHQLKDAPKP